jgi:hypothetical protein
VPYQHKSIFLCHSPADQIIVSIVKNHLKNYAIRTWNEEDEIHPGYRLMEIVLQNVEEMSHFGLIVSSESIRSNWFRKELEEVRKVLLIPAGIPLITVYIKQITPPIILANEKSVRIPNWYSDPEQKRVNHEVIDRSIRQLLRLMKVDPNDKNRWSGKKMIKMGDFRRRIEAFFAPCQVVIEFDEDWSGLDFIRVDEGYGIFQLYTYWSKPSYLDLITEIFGRTGEERINDLKLVDTNVWTEEERQKAVYEICLKYGIEVEQFWKQRDHISWADYQEWLDNQTPVSLIREGDFGGD